MPMVNLDGFHKRLTLFVAAGVRTWSAIDVNARFAGAKLMNTYRAYPISQDGHIAGPAVIIEAPTDQEAVSTAQQQANIHEHPVEVWHSTRRVILLEPDKASRERLLRVS